MPTKNVITIPRPENYEYFLEDLKATFVEFDTTIRDYEIKGKHEIGKQIREGAAALELDITDLVQLIAVDLNMSTRMIWYSVKFFDIAPNLDEFMAQLGKHYSWTKIIRNYLTESREPAEIEDFAMPSRDLLEKTARTNFDYLIENAKKRKDGIWLFLPKEMF